MKKIIFGLLLTMGMLNAQNNLVFNKALNFRLVPGNDGINLGQTATVPEGKVWKIESYQRDGAGGINVGFEIQDPEYGSAISYGSYSSTPIWLQEGTILKAPSDGIFFSVLEFNVVPTSTGTGSGTGGGGVSSDGLVIDQVISIKYESNQLVFGTLTVPPGKIFKLNSFTSYRVYSGDNIQCINSDSFMFGDYPINYGLEGSHRYFTEGDHIIRKYGTSCNSNNVVIDGAFYHSN